jgi:phosphatidylglycerol lysyltransferase
VPKGRIALTLGDPIGPQPDAAGCLADFQRFCTANDWQPAFYQVQPGRLEHYRQAGFQGLCIGQEAIVDVPSFTLAGGENKNLRTAMNRLTRLNHRAEVIPPPISDDLLAEMRQVSDEWLTLVHGTEMRFSLGWFDEAYLRSGAVIVLRDPEGRLEAFANIVPEYQLSEISIDLMRHRRESENGLMDFLFVSLLQWARAQGYATFNLGLSALAGIGESPEDPALERALRYIYEHVSRFYNFKGLHAFKEKFHPQWSPRYLVYPGAASLPAVVLALARADAGDNNFWSGYMKKTVRL